MTKPFIIGITGGSGSGKTTLINALMEAYTKEQICKVCQDDYYRPRTEQFVDSEGVKNFDLPNSINDTAFFVDLQKLIKGEPVVKQEYTFNNEKAVSKELTLNPAPIIIVEGLFVFHYEKIRNLFDLKIFIETKDTLKVVRRIKRDRVERNYPLNDVLYRYDKHVLPAYEKYIKPYQSDCDIVINNNTKFDAGLDVLVGFLKDKLKK